MAFPSMQLHGGRTRKYLNTILIWPLVLLIAFPLYWMLVSSVKTEREVMAQPPTIWPEDFTLENFDALRGLNFGTWFFNSVVVAAATVGVVLVLATLASYSLVRCKYPGRSVVSGSMLVAYLFPQVLMLVPLFLVISNLGLNDTYMALILANVTFSLPLALWLLRSQFEAVPRELEEAASVDGASWLLTFTRIFLPQVLPGILSTAIITFILAWNNYLFALVFVSSADLKTLPVGIATYSNELNTQWGPLMASCVAVSVPVLVVMTLLQRQFMRGASSGGLKG
jgi:multiple sugar transport system permease protein